MAHNPAIDLASTLQSASIKRHPSPTHDLNPSTAASKKTPVTLSSEPEAAHYSDDDSASLASDLVSERHVLKPRPRRAQLPPLPDLRFEQSYLASLKGETRWNIVAWITVRDQVCRSIIRDLRSLQSNPKHHPQIYLPQPQTNHLNHNKKVLMPLLQGTLWTLAVCGWRHWNSTAHFHGQSLGSRFRRWWYDVNNWKIPSPSSKINVNDKKLAARVEEVGSSFQRGFEGEMRL